MPRPAGGRRPWWRRGVFWFVVIVVEAIVALVLSFVVAPADHHDVSLAGPVPARVTDASAVWAPRG